MAFAEMAVAESDDDNAYYGGAGGGGGRYAPVSPGKASLRALKETIRLRDELNSTEGLVHASAIGSYPANLNP